MTFLYCEHCKCVREAGVCDHEQGLRTNSRHIAVFDPYYDTNFRKEVSSYHEQEKAMKKFNREHPKEAMQPINDKRKFIQECKTIARERKRAVHVKRFFVLALLTLLSTNAFSAIDPFEGIDMAKVTINGKEYTFPVGDTERQNKIYYLKKGLNGDKEAMQMFMGDEKEAWFFIGTYYPIWLHIKDGKMEVLEYPEK